MAKPKTSFRFTAAAIDRIKPPEAGRIDYSNTALPGMQLRVSAARLGKEPKKVYRVKNAYRGQAGTDDARQRRRHVLGGGEQEGAGVPRTSIGGREFSREAPAARGRGEGRRKR